MQGRKPKPTALKKLEGNPGKRALNTKEPKPKPAIPRCPSHLNTVARREWKRVTFKLYEMGVLTQTDRAALASYCVAYAHWVMAEEKLKIEEAVIETGKGNLVQNPWIQISKRSMEQVVKFAAEFGMTPSSRARLIVDTHDDEDEMAGLLFGSAVKVK